MYPMYHMYVSHRLGDCDQGAGHGHWVMVT
jgi:hypothetical protein